MAIPQAVLFDPLESTVRDARPDFEADQLRVCWLLGGVRSRPRDNTQARGLRTLPIDI